MIISLVVLVSENLCSSIDIVGALGTVSKKYGELHGANSDCNRDTALGEKIAVQKGLNTPEHAEE